LSTNGTDLSSTGAVMTGTGDGVFALPPATPLAQPDIAMYNSEVVTVIAKNRARILFS
jgi:hypothetical protein